MNPTTPPKGMQKRNDFWQDHVNRIGYFGDWECTCAEPGDNYGCLLSDAEFYASATEWDMPGLGNLIPSARAIVKSFRSGAVKKFQDREAEREANRFRL